MREELDSFELVAKTIDRVSKNGRFTDFELSNGIVLTLKPLPPFLLQAVMNEFKEPPVPTVYMEDKGRQEPNPNDPVYLAECVDVARRQNNAVNDLLMSAGTYIKSIPEGYFPPDSDEWIDQVEAVVNIVNQKLEINTDNKTKRYLCWLKFYALENSTDAAALNTIATSLAGISEKEVEEVIESFRSISERGADTDDTAVHASENGNTANRSERRASARNRRA